jgi:hypothetical protein
LHLSETMAWLWTDAEFYLHMALFHPYEHRFRAESKPANFNSGNTGPNIFQPKATSAENADPELH